MLFINLELDNMQFSNRLANTLHTALHQQIPISADSQEEINNLLPSEYLIKKFNFYLAKNTNGKISQIVDFIDKAIAEHNVKIICLDYLQLVYPKYSSKNRETEIHEILRTLKQIALEKKLCIILTNQLSRAVENRGGNKIPMLSDFRDSGSIEEIADKVFFIYRYDYYHIEFDENGCATDNIMQLIVAKNKTGNTGTIQILRNNDFTNFSEFAPKEKLFNYTDNPFEDFDNNTEP